MSDRPSEKLPTGDEPTVLSGWVGSEGGEARQHPAPGRQFGPYRIERLLGRGGMGEVYEAEHVEHGRRVAVKVLNQALADRTDRDRFLREGRLAASVTHPNTVYIYGSEEIDGTPVIAMELLSAGTLKDRVKQTGPMPPAEAVDAILQVIAGLEAAHGMGVLHRDVKPSNCFVDRDGAVKIGDFGLSISARARDVTQLTTTGTFLGTPQFAPPEQIRGEPLDVRADIYAIGGTLHYLLTGKPPFDTTDLMALIARVTTDQPPSPRTVAPHIPRGLAAIVLHCLAKDPHKRPATYAALAEELRPFSSEATTPATVGLRVLASVIDWSLVSLPFTIAVLPLTFDLDRHDTLVLALSLANVVTVTAYYGLLEGLLGRSVGKRVCGLRVRRTGGQPIGLGRAFGRTALFMVPAVIPLIPAVILGSAQMIEWQVELSWQGVLQGYGVFVLLALLFSTARRRNGFAGLHDLATDARVVRFSDADLAAVFDHPKQLARPTDADRRPARYGPYEVQGTLGSTGAGELLLGLDPALGRQVWIHVVPIGTEPVPPLRREIGRAGRLRWLNGRRTDDESWDAYECPAGSALLAEGARGQPASLVGRWLADLATELDAAVADGSMPVLSGDRVWVTPSGGVRLLDFRAPGVPDAPAAEAPVTPESAQRFLAGLAAATLGTGATASDQRGRPPLPVAVRSVVDSLGGGRYATLADAASALRQLRKVPDRVTAYRRTLSMAPLWLVPVVIAISVLGFAYVARNAVDADVLVLSRSLDEIEARVEASADGTADADTRAEIDVLEAYVAGRFGSLIADPDTWTTPFMVGMIGRHRDIAEAAVANHPDVTDVDLDALRAEHPELIDDVESVENTPDSVVAAVVGAMATVLMAMVALVTAVLFRGGVLLRICRMAVVDRLGSEVSRWRTLARAVIAWLPIGVGVGLLLLDVPWPVAAAIAGVLQLTGIVWAVVRPARGIQDRITGTWLVPR
ncbi:MAG TPA: protein kinase [Vicinamibacterales bacterium]|nr:protein kinase [Vicinamibacterales bacterium]